MSKKGVKPGTKREPYKKKSPEELAKAKAKRESEADEILGDFLVQKWTKDWQNPDVLKNVYLSSFAGLDTQRCATILGVSHNELLEALKEFPEVSAYWSKGQQEIITLCHISLAQRIKGMKVTEIRTTQKADGNVDQTFIEKELPPDVDAIKFFLVNRVPEYQQQSAAMQFEQRLDSMLSRLEYLDKGSIDQ